MDIGHNGDAQRATPSKSYIKNVGRCVIPGTAQASATWRISSELPERAGDVDGMAALYERDAVLDCGDSRLMIGREAIRAFYAKLVTMGRKFDFGDQRAAIISGDLALTSTRLPDGSVTAEVARRQGDGTWLWVIDRFSIV